MPSLESYFQAQGKSFESYSKWLAVATPEELLAAGVRPGMLVQLYGSQKSFPESDRNENIIAKYAISSEYLCNGFTLCKEGSSKIYTYDKNKNVELVVVEYSSVHLTSDIPRDDDKMLTQDISPILQGLIAFIQRKKISSRLLPSCATEFEYEIKNYVNSPEGFKIFQG